MNASRNHWIFLSSLASVFLITLIFAYGPGYTGNFSAFLGLAAGKDALRSETPSQMSQSDMVTPMVTKKSMVTNNDVTNVTMMSPQKSQDIKAVASSSPTSSPFLAIVTSSPYPTLNTFTPSPSMSPILSALSPSPTPTATQETDAVGNVIISEVAWMGTKDSANDEWIELFNAGTVPVNLQGWRLASIVDNNPSIPLDGTIPARSYYLIERTNDSTVSDIPAQLIRPFGSGLNNAGESLVLIDAEGTVRDGVDASNGWFAGNNADKASMERVSPEADGSLPGSWATNSGTVRTGHDSGGNPVIGTPGAPNSSGRF